MRLLLALATVVGALALAPAAFADYWFFQGWLPRPDGTIAVHTPADRNCCYPDINYVRISWQCGTHQMVYFFIEGNGNWETYRTTSSCDEEHWYNWHYYLGGGCENPPGYYTVWTNCHHARTP
jgi:hypothetical protein